MRLPLRTLLSALAAIVVLVPVQSAYAVPILPAGHDGTSVWTGNDTQELDATEIGVIVGQSGLSSLYEAGFGHAQLTTIGEADRRVTITAKQAGIAGHDIVIEILEPGSADSPLSVSVTGREITVHLATDAAGEVISTANNVADAINAAPAASSLVEASAGGDGVVTGQPAAFLEPVIVEAGPLASSYSTAFSNSPRFPQDASITHDGGDAIGASSSFLYIRDASNQPAFYIYDLLAPAIDWNGLDALDLQGFGKIAQLEIVGGTSPTTVPEGSSLALLALGLGALAWTGRRKRSLR